MISLEQLNGLCEKIKTLRAEKEDIESTLKAVTNNLEKLKLDVLEILKQNNMTSFPSNAGITVGIRNEFHVSQPQTPEAEKEFNEFLKSNNLDHMRKVNSQTLNAWYREQIEIASEKGEIVVIPGLETPTTRTTLTIRKGK